MIKWSFLVHLAHVHYQPDNSQLFNNSVMHTSNPALCPQTSLWHNVSIRDICRAHSSQITPTSPSALPSCPCCLQATVYKFSKLTNILRMLLQLNLQKCYIIHIFTSCGLSQPFSPPNTLTKWKETIQ